MNLKKINTERKTEEVATPQAEGLKVKSHVKAGLATPALATPRLREVALNPGIVFVCG